VTEIDSHRTHILVCITCRVADPAATSPIDAIGGAALADATGDVTARLPPLDFEEAT
jgi:hypothetical protein